MSTSDRAREFMQDWHCKDTGAVAGRTVLEITALLDLLVEAKQELGAHSGTHHCAKVLIEKIDKVVGK